MIVDDRCWGSSEDVNLLVGAYVRISNVSVLPIGKGGGHGAPWRAAGNAGSRRRGALGRVLTWG